MVIKLIKSCFFFVLFYLGELKYRSWNYECMLVHGKKCVCVPLEVSHSQRCFLWEKTSQGCLQGFGQLVLAEPTLNRPSAECEGSGYAAGILCVSVIFKGYPSKGASNFPYGFTNPKNVRIWVGGLAQIWTLFGFVNLYRKLDAPWMYSQL